MSPSDAIQLQLVVEDPLDPLVYLALEELSPPHLDQLVATRLEGYPEHVAHPPQELTALFEEQLIALSGGYRLVHPNVLLSPRCCADLSDIASWHALTQWTSSEQTTIWIGHPELRASAEGELLHVWPTPLEQERIILARDALLHAVAEARRQQHDLHRRLTHHLSPRYPHHAEAMSRILSGLG